MDQFAKFLICLILITCTHIRVHSAPYMYNHCTMLHDWNKQTHVQELSGLICVLNRGMLDTRDKMPRIRELQLEGEGCSSDWDVIPWVTSHLQMPEALQSLSVRSCQGICIQENDMVPLQNLRDLAISDGTIRFLHPRAFSSLSFLQRVRLVRLGLRNFPDVVRGRLNNQTDAGWPELQRLDLSHNAIADIPADAFACLVNLTFLDLAQNRLQRLDAEPFQYLGNLETLNVSMNTISSLPSSGFSGRLHRLRRLIIRSNDITKLSTNSFAGLKGLRYLDLSINPVNTLHGLALQGLDSLEEINFLFNPLGSVPQELFQAVYATLQKINLSECKLSDVPLGLFDNLSQLEEVDLSRNAISSLENMSSTHFPSLTKMNVAFNLISEIPPRFFEQTPLIEAVYLEGNVIHKIEMLAISSLRYLQEVDLSRNNLTTLSRRAFHNLLSFRALDLSDNSLFRIPSDALDNIPSLQELILTDNHLTNFQWFPFLNQDAMRPTLHPDKAVSVNMHSNLLRCDCEMYSLVVDQEYIDIFWPGSNLLANQRFENYKELACSWPPPWRGETLYSADEEKKLETFVFVRTSLFFCPQSCQCYTRCEDSLNITLCSTANLTSVPQNLSENINVLNLAFNRLDGIPPGSFSHMTYLLQIDLRGNNLTDIKDIFTGLRNLNTILLGYNKISSLSDKDFKGLVSLKYLQLDHNSISFIDPLTFANLMKLQYLYLDHNVLTDLQWEVLNNTQDLKALTLNNNPLVCDCDLMWLKDWLQTKVNVLEHLDSINCTTLSNETGAVLYFDEGDFMCGTSHAVQTIAIILGMLVLLMSAFAVVYRFRKVLQVVVYNHTGLRFHNKADKDVTKTYQYDAFISFCSDDLNFVTQELVPNLEGHQPPFKLCIHQRDFVVGECISTNIINAVETSRRTVIVLTNNYVTSEWCSFEFKAAHQQLLQDHQNRLIVILLEEVDRSILDKDLKLYLSTNTYLERRDTMFWQKLYYAMPDKTKVGLDNEQDNPNLGRQNSKTEEVELHDDLQQLIREQNN